MRNLEVLRFLLIPALVLATAAPVAARQTPTPTPGPVSTVPASPGPLQDYALGPKDLLEIKVLEIPDLNGDRRVTENGTIDLPMLGDFSVAGLTAAQVRDRLEKMLLKYVNRANVSVIVKEFSNRPLSVVGAVQKPGSLNVSGRFTLLQALSAAGGLTERAGKTIYVLRTADNGLSDTIEINSEELFRGAGSRWNIPLLPGDVVNVDSKRSVRVFCLGAVKSPGALEFDADDRISILSVIAKAGGFTDKASSKLRVKRRGPDGKDSEMVVYFNRVVSGRDPDPILKPDDVVIVKESFF
jgi:polysaccharide biosynthesis/export protein